MTMTDRIVYDRKRLETWSIWLLKYEHPDWSYEKRQIEGVKPERMDFVYRCRMTVDLKNKMKEEGNGVGNNNFYFNQAKWIMDNVQPELFDNINEYIDGRPISDKKIHGISALDVMNQFGDEYPIGFTRAIKAMICWKDTGYQDPNYCRNFFAHV